MPIKRNLSVLRTRSGLQLSPRDKGTIAFAITSLMVIFINVASPRPALGESVKHKNVERSSRYDPQQASFPLAAVDIPPVLRLAGRSARGNLWKKFDAAPAAADLPGLLATLKLDRDHPAPPLMREPIVGIASTYNPCAVGMSEEGTRTASGEVYDAEAWTAAIQIGLRERFGGVRYGSTYRHAYALVESEDKRVIVKINDVGPMLPGRVIDLNERTMRYFDPTLELGLIPNVRITPLTGNDWTPGPVEDASRIGAVSARQNRPVREQLAANTN